MVIDEAFVKKFEMQIEVLKTLQKRVGEAIDSAQSKIERLKQGMTEGKSVEEVLKEK
ncbi:hypothetical protein QA648_33985 (plasmid) [Rhizobium sp. CB3171]|uniref:hypothetical protein n=1 Tax=Rhizobium sp. CB3171 TaxID=3039157 RepID=UPI0024B1942B|nr:hypothetical protein [Rhizobium sp. CB3171]WFU06795.1 hypothetical protein QA648_33985 [Rhizobium sp. CB3171]